LEGAAAGAIGTAALNIATYLDMTVRGRPSSGVPGQVAAKIAHRLGIDLGAGAESGDDADQKAQARTSGAGALMGYATGLGLGAAYGLLRSWKGTLKSTLPIPLAGVALGVAAMAASDIPATLTGSTQPQTWGISGWLSDILPHLIYGVTTALAYETLTGE
jgi:hypothetical protein